MAAPNFAGFAGNAFLASGINPNMPSVNLEGVGDPTVVANLQNIQGMLPTKGAQILLTPRIFGSRFDWIPRSNMPYGAFAELANWVTGPPVKIKDGKCIAYGEAKMLAEQWVSNWAYNIPLNLYDREINKVVLGPEQIQSYMSGKMQTPLNTMSIMRYVKWKQLFSDVIDGTRSITSKTSSDGTGSNATYAPTNIKGYAGKVITSTTPIPKLTYGSPSNAFSGSTGAADILTLLDSIKDAVTWAKYPSADYSKAIGTGDGYIFTNKMNLIMEEALLNEMDSVWTMKSDYKALGQSARSYIRSYLGEGSLIEIDVWPDLPTSSASTKKRLTAVLVDAEAPREFIMNESVEGQRCGQERMTSFTWQGEGVSAISKVLPSAAFINSDGSS